LTEALTFYKENISELKNKDEIERVGTNDYLEDLTNLVESSNSNFIFGDEQQQEEPPPQFEKAEFYDSDEDEDEEEEEEEEEEEDSGDQANDSQKFVF